MNISTVGINLVKSFEGCVLTEYKDAVGVPTIGWGHTGGVTPNMRITQAQADALLIKDLGKFVNDVNSLVKVPLNQNQFDALVSFDFNTGGLNKSTLLKKLNAKDYAGAALEFAKWNKGRVDGALVVLNGLTRRRAAEAALFNKPMPVISKPALKPYAGQLLKQGMMDNPYVKLAQGRLGIKADGDFGSGTYAAVRKFQEKNHLQVDGVIGQKTWNMLFK
jgi:lysozyme